ncbi:MAG TPA: hypothetical protein PKE39_15290, partial [Ignavibacteria bacterium]|nr:hypothetical protein [Ignavibacteria bacterium]HMR00386.1 hypothetical protein [Ignavibacteria bacterium]
MEDLSVRILRSELSKKIKDCENDNIKLLHVKNYISSLFFSEQYSFYDTQAILRYYYVLIDYLTKNFHEIDKNLKNEDFDIKQLIKSYKLFNFKLVVLATIILCTLQTYIVITNNLTILNIFDFFFIIIGPTLLAQILAEYCMNRICHLYPLIVEVECPQKNGQKIKSDNLSF